MRKIEIDEKTFDKIKALADRAELSEADTVKAMYYWLHTFYNGINGSIGTDLKSTLQKAIKSDK